MKQIFVIASFCIISIFLAACTPQAEQNTTETQPEAMQQTDETQANTQTQTAVLETEATIPPVDPKLDAQTQKDLKDLDTMMNKVDSSVYAEDTLNDLD